MDFIIITGMSGAGKSRAVDALEDIGFFCVDNIPPKLIRTFAQLILQSQEKRDKVAVVTDIRAGNFFDDFLESLDELKAMGCDYKLLFIERAMRSFAAGIRKRAVSTRFPIRQRAPSTTRLMRSGRFWRLPASARIILWIAPSTQPRSFASGLPECFWRTPPGSCKSTASRSASNMASQTNRIWFSMCGACQIPFMWTSSKATLLEAPVRDFVMKWPQAQGLVPKLMSLVDYLVPLYRNEGKSQLVIAVGCTGGRHRSVVFAELLSEHFAQQGLRVSIQHRDIKK